VSEPFLDRFAGIARLYGAVALEKFRAAHVAVIGLGGVGSWAAESLARSGIGRLTLMDPDDLCISNTNRQLHAVEGELGKPKCAALARRLALINPGLQLAELPSFYGPSSAQTLFADRPNAVIDAIDSLRAKCHLLATCREQDVPVVSSGAAGGRIDPTQVRVADLAHTTHDALLASVRKRLRAEHGFAKAPARGTVQPFGVDAVFSTEAPVFPTCDGGISAERPAGMAGAIGCDAGYGSVTHVTATFGLVAAGRVLQRLR
jgi:tRNA A37 threonylcarbamoyladenosine dehydratase